MRWFLTATVATLVALVLSAPTAAAERAQCAAATSDPWTWCWFPHPTGWEPVYQSIWSCERCRELGQQGVDDGRWSQYHCESFPQGLDFVYHLYVPPEG